MCINHNHHNASLFIEKAKVTSCEIPKLSLTCSLNLAGKVASELVHFQAGLSRFQVGLGRFQDRLGRFR